MTTINRTLRLHLVLPISIILYIPVECDVLNTKNEVVFNLFTCRITFTEYLYIILFMYILPTSYIII